MTEKRARYGSGSIKQVGRYWYIKWREVRRLPDGTAEYIQHRESTGSEDKAFAQKCLNRKLQDTGGRRAFIPDADEITYEEIRDQYVKEAIAEKKKSVRNGTIHFTRLDKFFGNYLIKDITVRSLKEFRQEQLKDGITESTVNRSMAAIRRMFNLAVINEWIEKDKVPSHFPTKPEPNKALGAVFIEDEWYEPLRRELVEPVKSAFVFCYHTGIRIGEMHKLQWQHFDFAKQQVIIPTEITKTNEARTLFIPADFKRKPGKPEDLVFPMGDMRFQWHKACVKLGYGHYIHRKGNCGAKCKGQVCPTHGQTNLRDLTYDGPDMRFTRHTFARNMYSTGMPEARIMDLTGHKTRSMIDRYNISKQDDVEDARLANEKAHRERQAKLKR